MSVKSVIEGLVRGVGPMDGLGEVHRGRALAWLASTDDIFRRVKPSTPSPHLVAYFLVVDRVAGSVLLCDHRLAGLWLPTGGHVEPGEHPAVTVTREAEEELGLRVLPCAGPFFVTVTRTVGVPADRHVDVSLWFEVAGRVGGPLRPDAGEFAGVRWWSRAELGAADPVRFEPHLGRALVALDLAG